VVPAWVRERLYWVNGATLLLKNPNDTGLLLLITAVNDVLAVSLLVVGVIEVMRTLMYTLSSDWMLTALESTRFTKYCPWGNEIELTLIVVPDWVKVNGVWVNGLEVNWNDPETILLAPDKVIV
jgi:hypothetical protein